MGESSVAMGIQNIGIEGERWLLNKFRSKGIHCFQPDAISREKGKYVLNEIKQQEKYIGPPFDGQGLPKWQIHARLEFWKRTGIRCRFLAIDTVENLLYVQWLDVLEQGDHYDTAGNKPRRVYSVDSFLILSYNDVGDTL